MEIQPQYYEGADILQNCVSGNGSAGKYGNMEVIGACDLPWETFEATFQFMKKTYAKPDFILWTGDVVFELLQL